MDIVYEDVDKFELLMEDLREVLVKHTGGDFEILSVEEDETGVMFTVTAEYKDA
jgi:hypothetical protein